MKWKKSEDYNPKSLYDVLNESHTHQAGLIEEMLDDALEDEEVSDEADEQLDMVMDEILQGVKTAPTTNAALPAAEVEQTEEADEMQARLAQLKA